MGIVACNREPAFTLEQLCNPLTVAGIECPVFISVCELNSGKTRVIEVGRMPIAATQQDSLQKRHWFFCVGGERDGVSVLQPENISNSMLAPCPKPLFSAVAGTGKKILIAE